jgi:hypothetical protein
MKRTKLVTLIVVVLTPYAMSAPAAGALQVEQASVIGRWDLTVTTASGSHPSWLEVRQSGDRTLVGRFVGQAGSARPIARIEFSDDVLRFAIPPQWEPGDGDLRVEGELDGERLSGWMIDPAGNRSTWTAHRAPSLRRTSPPAWEAPIVLFDGTDMAHWEASDESHWRVVDGTLTNVQSGANLITRQAFTDFRLHIEFRYPENGNSGVYLRGRYEVQIEDSKGPEPSDIHLGAIYGFLPPSDIHAKQPGEWQSFDITLVGRMVTVELNGTTIISNREIPGITGGALDSAEAAPGPLMLQGDHGPVEYRNIVLTPARRAP